MLKGDTDPEKRPVRAQDSRTTKRGQFGTLLKKTITDNMTRKTMDSKRTFFLAAQTNHGRIGTDQRQVSQGTPTRTRSEEEHGHTHPGYAGGTGITIISGYWNKRNGGNPFSQITTRQAEKPVSDNTGIPDRIDRHMGPTHTGQGTLR